MKRLATFIFACLLTAWVGVPAAPAAQLEMPTFDQPTLSPQGPAAPPEPNRGPKPQASSASGEAESPGALKDFGACIAGNGGADLVLVMDESASLSGYKGEEATDPDNVRVAAAKDFVGQLAQYSQDTGAKFNIRLAGFDENYHRYGDWTQLSGDGKQIQDDVQKFSDRATGLYTDYRKGLSGAFEDIAGGSSECQAVLFFSDGRPTADGASSEQIMDEVCSAPGPVARLRASGVRLFTIGLSVSESDPNDSPLERLRRISESNDCSGYPANGAMLSAEDPAALFGAFRGMLPRGASTTREGVAIDDVFSFVLDNSVAPVQLSAQPDRKVDGTIVPTLTSPSGDQVELASGQQEIDGHKLDVRTNDALPGMVDVRLEPGAGQWAGEWKFGYRAENKDAKYRAVMSIAPGLKMQVDGGDGAISKSSDEKLAVSLVGNNGQVHKLEGSAVLSAELLPADGGAPKQLAQNQDIADGEASVALDSIADRFAGNLRLRVDITTANAGSVPGTKLAPLEFEAPISIAPSNMPKLPGKVSISMVGDETTLDVPVSGPGKVWLEDSSFAASDGTELKFTSESTKDKPLELQRGEKQSLKVKVKADKAVDATIDGVVKLGASEDSGASAETVDVKTAGSMSAPINATVFGTALIFVLILALLIPLVVLYLMKYISGRIPRRPGIQALRVPVGVQNSQLIRTDRGGEFNVSHDEVIQAARTSSTGRSVNLAGEEVAVKTGWNPLDPPKVLATSKPSISDNGAQSAGRAQLPMGVHDHWLMVMDPHNKLNASVIIAADEAITHEHLEKIVADIRQHGPQRFEKLSEQVGEATGPGAGKDPTQPGGFGTVKAGKSQSDWAMPTKSGAQPSSGSFGGNTPNGGFGQPPQQANTGGFGQPGQQGGSGFGQPPSSNGFGRPDSRS